MDFSYFVMVWKICEHACARRVDPDSSYIASYSSCSSYNCISIRFCLYIIGIIWPLEGLPRSIQWVSNLVPYTYAAIGVKAVASKGIMFYIMHAIASYMLSFSLGMGIGDRQVYEGILITLGWVCLYLFLVFLIYRR